MYSGELGVQRGGHYSLGAGAAINGSKEPLIICQDPSRSFMSCFTFIVVALCFFVVKMLFGFPKDFLRFYKYCSSINSLLIEDYFQPNFHRLNVVFEHNEYNAQTCLKGQKIRANTAQTHGPPRNI